MIPPDWLDDYPQANLPTVRDFQMKSIDPDAYMYLNGYSPPAKTSSCTSLVPIKRDFIDVEIVNVKTPRIAELEIEDIGDDLMEGVKTTLLKDVVKFTPPIYSKSPRHIGQKKIDDTTVDSNGNCKIVVESYFDNSSLFGHKHNWEDDAWGIFNIIGISIIDQGMCKIASSSQQFCKIEQNYVLKVTDTSSVPYLQLVCNASRSKYLGQWYNRGDVITLFVKHSQMPSVPDPALVTINSTDKSVLVPMLPRQKLQIITNEKDSMLVFDRSNSLKHSYSTTMGRQARSIGNHVRCDYLECVKELSHSEVVQIYRCNEIIKTISVPALSQYRTGIGNKRFPMIIDPKGRLVIHTNNIDGFIVRSRKGSSLIIEKGCPLKLDYTISRPEYSETKVRIKEYSPTFVLEPTDRVGNVWKVKTG